MLKRKRSWILKDEWDAEVTQKGPAGPAGPDEKPTDAGADEKILADTEPRTAVK